MAAATIAKRLNAPPGSVVQCQDNPGQWQRWRFEGCLYWTLLFILKDQRNVVLGTALFEFTHWSVLPKGSLEWGERVDSRMLDATAEGWSSFHQISQRCEGGCLDLTTNEPGPIPPGVPSSATWTMRGFNEAPEPWTSFAHSETTVQVWTPRSTVEEVDEDEDENFGDHEVRCDTFRNYFGVNGCVFHQTTPTVEWEYNNPDFWEVTKHIRDAQAQGRPGAPGGQPLTRTWDDALQTANRNRACPSSFPTGPGQSCDEYPFATTREGAANNPFSARAVNDVHNRLHGTALNLELYSAERIIDGDRFYVRISGTPDKPTVMTVGDSITHGLEGDYTWRYRLQQHLASASQPVDFVGPYSGTNRLPSAQPPDFPTTSTPPSFDGTYRDNLGFDSQHFAQWGRQAAQTKWDIYPTVSRFEPDYLLVALGFNDLGWQVSTPDQLVVHTRELITNARAAKPGVRVLVANVVHRTPLAQVPNLDALIDEYNAKLGPAVAAMNTAQSPAALVDISTGYDPNRDAYDGLHPNGVGEFKIARAFANVLASRFSFGAPFGTVPSSVPSLTPSTPRSMNALAVDGGIRVHWEHSYGADGYWLFQRDVTAGQAFQKLPLPIPADSWTVGWVIRGHTYEFYVQPARGGTLGSVSPSASVVADPRTASGPINVTTSSGSHYIQLGWQPPTGIGSDSITGYRIYYKDENAPGSVAESVETGPRNRTFRLDGLITGHRYGLAMSTVNAHGEGPPTYIPPVLVTAGG